MSIGDLQPTHLKSNFRFEKSKIKILDVRGFKLIGVNDLAIHVWEPPFSVGGVYSVILLKENYRSISGPLYTLDDAYTFLRDAAPLTDWSRPEREIKADESLIMAIKSLVKRYEIDEPRL